MKFSLIHVFLVAVLGAGLASLTGRCDTLEEKDRPHQNAAPDEGQGPFEWEGNLRLDNDVNPDGNGTLKENLRTQRFELQGSARLLKNLPYDTARDLRFVLRTKMEQTFIAGNRWSVNHLSASDYVKEAYLQLKDIGNVPLTMLIGASEVSYGQDFRGTLDFQNDAAHAMTDPDNGQIKGVTLAFEKSLWGLVDKVEATGFSPDRDIRRLGLRHFDGFASRLSKKVSESLEVQTSLLSKGNGYNPDLAPETKVSAAGVLTERPWTAWVEAVKMSHSEAYPEAKVGATGGVARLVGPGQLNLEVTGIDRTLSQYALGYQLFISRYWTAGTTYRYTSCTGGNDGCVAARGFGEGPSFNFAVRFGFGGEENENPVWIEHTGDSRL